MILENHTVLKYFLRLKIGRFHPTTEFVDGPIRGAGLVPMLREL